MNTLINLDGHATRRVRLTGATNVRHIGGFLTNDGLTTPKNRYFRADSLHRLPQQAQQQLLDQGVRTVIDLRSPGERQKRPNILQTHPAITYRHIPLHGSDVAIPQATPQLSGMAVYYGFLLDQCQPALRETFALLAQPGAMPALVHCTAGKDRTGTVTAILLDLMGVPEAAIIADYALSGEYLEPILEDLIAQGVEDGFDAHEYAAFLESPPVAMADTLSYLHRVYGGGRAYLEHIGLTPTAIDQLLLALTQPQIQPLPRQ